MTKKIIVVGDVMLDSYWLGVSTRLSPEAPVPIINVQEIENRLGGAANVALNLAKLGANTEICGLIGEDNSGKIILEKLSDNGINTHLELSGTPTINKIRLISQNQQVVRADFEKKYEEYSIAKVTEKALTAVRTASVVICSDYGKGVLTNVSKMISQCRMLNIPVLIDPKGNDYKKYKGATVITPNKNELRAVVGEWSDETDLRVKAQNLRTDLQLEKLLLTRSEEGMTLFGENEIIDIPTNAREVYDVSGAGDTAIATLALMLSNGKSWKEAVMMANKAAGIVVGRFGTVAITASELQGTSKNNQGSKFLIPLF